MKFIRKFLYNFSMMNSEDLKKLVLKLLPVYNIIFLLGVAVISGKLMTISWLLAFITTVVCVTLCISTLIYIVITVNKSVNEED